MKEKTATRLGIFLMLTFLWLVYTAFAIIWEVTFFTYIFNMAFLIVILPSTIIGVYLALRL